MSRSTSGWYRSRLSTGRKRAFCVAHWAATALSGDEARDAYSEARRSGDRALALDPELAYAHIARGWLLENADLDWAGATREYISQCRKKARHYFHDWYRLAVHEALPAAARAAARASAG